MNCEAARDRLLIADNPARVDADLAEHVAGCAACSQMVGDLVRLESAVRSYPMPATVLIRREVFLTNLKPMPARQIRARHLIAAFATIAAAIIIGIVTVALVHNPQPDDGRATVAQARPAVVEDLVEWTLLLTESEVPAEREKLVRERLPELQAAVQRADLSVEDRAFAEQLLAHGRKLGEGADPVDEAEAFHGVADTLLVRLDTSAQDPSRFGFYAQLYSNVVDRGVETNLKKAEKQALRAERQARVQELRKANKKQAARVADLVERMPEQARGAKGKAKAVTRPK
ncbi:MAG TPA: hypothetical protein VHR66_27485 [Gemmataceae bacterium]|jgi:hypothetical protein|nr:hypothetical protein [Gemmataceae bacterium]